MYFFIFIIFIMIFQQSQFKYRQIYLMQKKGKVQKLKVQLSKPRTRTKSRDKTTSISCNKSKDNIRLRTKTDYNTSLFQYSIKEDEKQIRTKPFISLNEDPQNQYFHVSKKNKQIFENELNETKQKLASKKKKRKSPNLVKKKTKTYNNSNTFDLKNYNPKKKQSQANPEKKCKSKDKLIKIKDEKKTKHSLQIQKKSKTKLKINIQDSSELQTKTFLTNHMMTVTSNSDIKFPSNIFSGRSIIGDSNQRKQEIVVQQPKKLFEIDPNALLRVHLKKQYKRKIEAVIKIQKIWRGYQTRKLLQQYILQQEPKLANLLKEMKQNIKIDEFSIENQIKTIQSNSFQYIQKQINQINIIDQEDNLNPPNNNDNREQIPSLQQDSNLLKEDIYSPYSPIINNLDNNQITQSDQNSQKIDIYRHKQLYTQDDINNFEKSGAEEEEKIIEQKYEYIANSQGSIKNDNIIVYEQNNQKQDDFKDSILENLDLMSKKKNSDTLLLSQIRKNKSPEILLQQNEKSISKQQSQESTKTQYKEQVIKIKKQEISKWDNMIKFIQENFKIKKNDLNYQDIINKIIEESQSNKKWLENNLPKNQETLETRFGTNEEDFEHESRMRPLEQFINANLNRETEQYQLSSPKEQSKAKKSQGPSFKKKKLFLNLQTICLNQPQNLNLKFQNQNSNSQISLSDSKTKKNFEINKIEIRDLLQNKYSSQFQCKNISDIIVIRQQLLKQRQIVQFEKLNKLMKTKKIDIGEYYNKIEEIKKYINMETIEIQKSKQEIQKGLKTVENIIKKTQKQASLLGRKIGLSKSTETFKKTYSQIIEAEESSYMLNLENINQNRERNNIFFENQLSHRSNASLQLTSQEERILHQCLVSNKIEIKDLNTSVHSQKIQDELLNVSLLQQSFSHINPDIKQYLEVLTQELIYKEILNLAVELFMNNRFFPAISKKFNIGVYTLDPIIFEERILFLQMLEQFLPEPQNFLQILENIQQQRSMQLLKQYRVSETDDDIVPNKKIQIIKKQYFYEIIIKLKNSLKFRESDQTELNQYKNLIPGLSERINQKQIMIKLKKEDILNKRLQILTLESLAIFDCWNEILQEGMNVAEEKNYLKINDWLNKPIQSKEFLIHNMSMNVNSSKDSMVNLLSDDKYQLPSGNGLQNQYSQKLANELRLRIGLQIDFIIGQILISQIAYQINSITTHRSTMHL